MGMLQKRTLRLYGGFNDPKIYERIDYFSMDVKVDMPIGLNELVAKLEVVEDASR